MTYSSLQRGIGGRAWQTLPPEHRLDDVVLSRYGPRKTVAIILKYAYLFIFGGLDRIYALVGDEDAAAEVAVGSQPFLL